MPYKSPRYQFTMIDQDGRHTAEIELPDDGEAERVGRELMIGQLMGMAKRAQAQAQAREAREAGEAGDARVDVRVGVRVDVRVEVKRVIWSSEDVREKVLGAGI